MLCTPFVGPVNAAEFQKPLTLVRALSFGPGVYGLTPGTRGALQLQAVPPAKYGPVKLPGALAMPPILPWQLKLFRTPLSEIQMGSSFQPPIIASSNALAFPATRAPLPKGKPYSPESLKT